MKELLRLLRTHRPELIGNVHITQNERREIAALWQLYELTGVA